MVDGTGRHGRTERGLRLRFVPESGGGCQETARESRKQEPSEIQKVQKNRGWTAKERRGRMTVACSRERKRESGEVGERKRKREREK